MDLSKLKMIVAMNLLDDVKQELETVARLLDDVPNGCGLADPARDLITGIEGLIEDCYTIGWGEVGEVSIAAEKEIEAWAKKLKLRKLKHSNATSKRKSRSKKRKGSS